MNIAYFVLAFCAGAAIATQAIVNGQLTASVGGNTVVAALISFFVGGVLLALIAFSRGGMASALATLPSVSLWKYLGGFLGAGFIFSTTFLAPRIGLANVLALVIAGQLIASLTIDHLGLLGAMQRPVSVTKLGGAVVLLLGVSMILFGDRVLANLARHSGA
jgi:transporter family-2 protein